MVLQRTYWSEERVDGKRIFRRVLEDKAILISSLTENNLHAPVFDFDFRVVQMGSEVTFKLDVDAHLWWKVLKELNRAGFMADAWFGAPDAKTGKLNNLQVLFPMQVVELRESSTAGHFHLCLNKEIEWRQYLKILEAMTEAGLIEAKYLGLCIEAQMGLLLKPALTKKEMPPSYTGYGISSFGGGRGGY